MAPVGSPGPNDDFDDDELPARPSLGVRIIALVLAIALALLIVDAFIAFVTGP